LLKKAGNGYETPDLAFFNIVSETIDVKKRFLRFLFMARFFTFLNVFFILPTFFIFKDVH